jgi:hypothetical protein
MKKSSPEQPNGWKEWSRYILKELERLNNCYEGLRNDVGKIREEIITLKVKSAVWGSVGGVIFAAIISVVVAILVN